MLRSAKTVGVGSLRESKTLITATLLGHEDPSVGDEADHGGVGQPTEHDLLLEPVGQRGRPGRRRGRRHQGRQRPEHQGHREHDGQDAVAVGGTATATG